MKILLLTAPVASAPLAEAIRRRAPELELIDYGRALRECLNKYTAHAVNSLRC